MLQHWIWFAERPEISGRTREVLIRYYADAEDLYYAESYPEEANLTAQALESLRDKNLDRAEKILQQCTDQGIRILTYRDAAYPSRLKNIPDPPMVLYYKGYLPELDGVPVIAIVGTRKASAYGLSVARKMGTQITACGGIVVSGLARGVDSMAMTGALNAGGPVVGVLGCGADVVYPASSRELYASTQARGCVLTEFPPGTPPAKWNFPRRNRIISGLSSGVLVVEAPEKSGALITARQAADQGRDVFVVPGNIDSDSCAGSNALLRDGAAAVCSGWDLLSEYEEMYPGKVHRPGKSPGADLEIVRGSGTVRPEEPRVAQNLQIPQKARKPKSEKSNIDKQTKSPYSDVNREQNSLTPEEKTIVSALGSESSLVDDVIDRCGLDAGKVLAALTMLEIKGVIQRLPGRQIRLAGK